jgi:hypothetical protein
MVIYDIIKMDNIICDTKLQSCYFGQGRVKWQDHMHS